ncbi:uncharacterized protein [Dysidea avara]
MTNADEGVYYCCVPDGPCGDSSSAHTTVQISTPPVLSATISTYISTAGSNVTLSCNISDKGMPPALLTWRRNGQDLSDGGIVSVNDTIMTLTLVNVTLESAGVYVCTATTVLSYRSAAVELFVKEMDNNSTNTLSQVVYLQSENARSSCHENELEEYLMVILQRFLYETCNCTDFEVLVNCNDTRGSNTVYSVRFVGPMADDLLKLWLMVERNSDDEIELGVATFTLCNQTCSGVVKGSSESALKLIPTGIMLVIIGIIIIITIILIVCGFICYYKYSPSHKNKSYTFDHRKRSSASTSSESGLMEPPANYDKLNHIKYSRESSSSLKQCKSQDENVSHAVMAIQQETYSTNKLTVTQMENGKGLIRSRNLTAIVDLGPSKDMMHDSFVTPSKTHPSYYDIKPPNSNADQT